VSTQVKTNEYAFDTCLTNVATNTTLGTATYHEFTAIPIRMPESSVTILSAYVEITARDAFSAGRNIQGWTIGIKLGAVAYDDLDHTPNAQLTTTDHETFVCTRDVTSYFTTNWASPSTNAQVRFRVANSAAAENINNITCKLYITYTYDSASTTHVKTVYIPIQGELGLLSTTKTEIGTTGNSAAAANQIPQLTGVGGFLPESSVSIEDAWIEILANDSSNTITTDYNLFVEIDSAGETARATLEQALATSTFFKDIYKYNTATYSPGSAHSFNVRSSQANRFQGICAILVVRYQFDPASATILNSIHHVIGNNHDLYYHSTTEKQWNYLELEVPEPGTIALKQSGVLLWVAAPGGMSLSVAAGGQTARTYVMINAVNSGSQPFLHRVDQGTSPWTLSRGYNRLVLTAAASLNLSGKTNKMMAILNYHSGRASTGPGSHNHTTRWFGGAFHSTGTIGATRSFDSTTQRFPVLGPHYYINNVGIDWRSRTGLNEFTLNVSLEIPAGSDEYWEAGWMSVQTAVLNDSELGTVEVGFEVTHLYNRTDQQSGKFNIETARDVFVMSNTGHYYSFTWMLTHHEVEFEVSDTVDNYPSGDGSGIPVRLFDIDHGVVVSAGVTTLGGAYSLPAYDDTREYFVEARYDDDYVGRSSNVTPTAV
jgi:hypothetical protein